MSLLPCCITVICVCLVTAGVSVYATSSDTYTTTLRSLWTEKGWKLPEEASSEEVVNAVARSLNIRRGFFSHEWDEERWSMINLSIRSAFDMPVNISASKCAVYENEFLDVNLRQSMLFECERGLSALRAYSREECIAQLDLGNRTIAEGALLDCMAADTASQSQMRQKTNSTDLSKDLRERKLGMIRRVGRGIAGIIETMLGLFTGYLAVNFYIVGVTMSILTISQVGLVFLNPLGALFVLSVVASTSVLTLISAHTLMKASRYMTRHLRQQQ